MRIGKYDLAVSASARYLPAACRTKAFGRLWKLLEITGDYWILLGILETTGNYWRYWRLLKITGDYWGY